MQYSVQHTCTLPYIAMYMYTVPQPGERCHHFTCEEDTTGHKAVNVYINVYIHVCSCYNNGCVVNGISARTAC